MKILDSLSIMLGLLALADFCRAQDWPQWMGKDRSGVYRGPVADALPKDGFKQRWKVPCGSGYAGPAVADGRVYLSDRVSTGEAKGGGARPGMERLICLDEKSGKTIWKREWDVPYLIDYGSGPRATPTVDGERLYLLGSEGDLRCLAVADGKTIWEKNLPKAYNCKAPTWGYAAHPLLWNGLLLTLAGGDGSACVALDATTGVEKWTSLSAGQIGYCPPVIVQHQGRTDAIVWTADAIHGVNPLDGKPLWSLSWSIRYGVSIANPRQLGNAVLVSNFWPGAKLLGLKADGSAPEVVWETEKESDRNTTHLNALMCTPMPVGDFLYGVCSYGQLRCLNWKTGERRWETFAATGGKELRWGTAFLTQIGSSNRFLIFNEQGELILATLTPEKYTEHGRQRLVEPDCADITERKLVWSHPAYANGACFARNDSSLVCVELK